MKAVWFLVAGLLMASGIGAAKNAEVGVGWDDHNTGSAYLRYYPETVVVWEGETVSWRAVSNTPHTVSQADVFAASPQAMYPSGGFESSAGFQMTPALAASWFGPGGFLLSAQSFSHTFNTTGSYVYICKIHPGMTGTITVVNGTQPGASPAPLPIPGQSAPANAGTPGGRVDVHAGWGSGDTTVDRFMPNNLTVPVNTTVVWTNTHSDEPHTVTGWLAGQVPAGGAPPTAPPAFDSSPNVQGEPPGFIGPTGVMMASGPNKVFNHTFASAGTWNYRCKLHAGMWGTVIVLAKPTSDATTSGNTTGTPRNTQAGSAVPGLELPLILGALAFVAMLGRRRRA